MPVPKPKFPNAIPLVVDERLDLEPLDLKYVYAIKIQMSPMRVETLLDLARILGKNERVLHREYMEWENADRARKSFSNKLRTYGQENVMGAPQTCGITRREVIMAIQGYLSMADYAFESEGHGVKFNQITHDECKIAEELALNTAVWAPGP